MTPQLIRQMIEEGETDRVEFKRQFTTLDKMARELSALANTAGGVMLIGVSDHGEILGVHGPDQVRQQVDDTCAYHVDPPLGVESLTVELAGKALVVVTVPNSLTKPHQLLGETRLAGQVYLRHHSFTVPASADMIKVLMTRDESQIETVVLDKMEQALIDYLQVNVQITLKQYCRWVNISERRGSRILTKLVKSGILNLFQHEREDYYGLNPLWLQRL